jgi:hypothetical protein
MYQMHRRYFSYDEYPLYKKRRAHRVPREKTSELGHNAPKGWFDGIQRKIRMNQQIESK